MGEAINSGPATRSEWGVCSYEWKVLVTLTGDTCPPGPELLGGAAVGRALMALEQLGVVEDDLAPETREPGTPAGFMGVEAGPGEASGELEDSAEGSRQ